MERIRPNTGGPGNQQPSNQNRSNNDFASRTVQKATGGPTLASKVLVGLLMVAALVFIVNATMQLFGKDQPRLGSAKVDRDGYQAVFLDNGQVYFGKLSDVNSEFVKLTDIYYLQVRQQGSDDDEGLQPAPNQQQVQPVLVKLGSELHGPEDVMFISRDKVLFWENLKDKDNSKVVEAIEREKDGAKE